MLVGATGAPCLLRQALRLQESASGVGERCTRAEQLPAEQGLAEPVHHALKLRQLIAHRGELAQLEERIDSPEPSPGRMRCTCTASGNLQEPGAQGQPLLDALRTRRR